MLDRFVPGRHWPAPSGVSVVLGCLPIAGVGGVDVLPLKNVGASDRGRSEKREQRGQRGRNRDRPVFRHGIFLSFFGVIRDKISRSFVRARARDRWFGRREGEGAVFIAEIGQPGLSVAVGVHAITDDDRAVRRNRSCRLQLPAS